MTVAEIVDTTALWQTIVLSAAAGLGVTFAFAIAILGAARSIESSHDGRSIAAIAFGAVTVVALAAIAAAVVLAVIVLVSK